MVTTFVAPPRKEASSTTAAASKTKHKPPLSAPQRPGYFHFAPTENTTSPPSVELARRPYAPPAFNPTKAAYDLKLKIEHGSASDLKNFLLGMNTDERHQMIQRWEKVRNGSKNAYTQIWQLFSKHHPTERNNLFHNYLVPGLRVKGGSDRQAYELYEYHGKKMDTDGLYQFKDRNAYIKTLTAKTPQGEDLRNLYTTYYGRLGFNPDQDINLQRQNPDIEAASTAYNQLTQKGHNFETLTYDVIEGLRAYDKQNGTHYIEDIRNWPICERFSATK